MCGICGFVGLTSDPEDQARLLDMNDGLVHRGPDDWGGYLSGRGAFFHRAEGEARNDGVAAALAMRRLAIIDVNAGRQPITNEDGSLWIVYNGEIYNYKSLRTRLENKGHRFQTNSDTEVVIHAFEEYGVECVQLLRGMFAFALWDERSETLFLARDHTGIKPLFYTEVDDRFLFASEIKALLRYPKIPRKLSQEGLYHFLSYLYVPAPGTMFDGIKQLPPGHRLVWSKARFQVEEYWRGPAAWVEPRAARAPATPSQLWDVLRESVESHLVSEVPLGAFLSGGIDSSAIVALMAELVERPVRTFSIGFREAGRYDETEHARAMARFAGTDHTEFQVAPEAVMELPTILWYLDEPLADASVIPNFFLAQMARQHVTVALTGIGGDELFGGYRRYFGHRLAARARLLPRFLRQRVLLPALRSLPAGDATPWQSAVRLAEKFLTPLDLTPEERYIAWNSFFTEHEKECLLAKNGNGHRPSAETYRDMMRQVEHLPFADRAMLLDLRTYLPGDPLCLADRMTMAHSLEARVPFVDLKVMEFAARIPVDQKLRGTGTKLILREASKGHIAPSLLDRPKQGFGTPIDMWLRRELKTLPDQLLSEAVLKERGLFRADYVRQLVERQRAGGRDTSQHIWALLMLELWHRMFVDRDPTGRSDMTFSDLGIAV